MRIFEPDSLKSIDLGYVRRAILERVFNRTPYVLFLFI